MKCSGVSEVAREIDEVLLWLSNPEPTHSCIRVYRFNHSECIKEGLTGYYTVHSVFTT